MEADLSDLIRSWHLNRHHVFASDLVGAAITSGVVPEAVEAAEFLLEDTDSSSLARRLAQRVLRQEGNDEQLALIPREEDLDRAAIATRIGRLRSRSVGDPRNVLLWVERSRLHTLRGQSESAAKEMRVALALAPNDRFVLRAASRLWIHQADPSEAHRLLLRSGRTKHDPWLIAAEIATASVANRRPHFAKAGLAMLERGLDPKHATELASSLATLELENGNDRRARRLFAQSLDEPNDNALAQAEWASPQVTIVDLHMQFDRVPDSWEARALDAAADANYDVAIREAFSWLIDQPYSTDAAVFGSYHASKIEAYDDGIRFAEMGLLANPRDSMLLNNLAFCLAKTDRVAAAREVLGRIVPTSNDPDDRGATSKATRGLLEFRSGNIDEGHRLYSEAVREIKDPTRKLIAFLMMAAEILRLQPEDEEQIKETVTREASRATDAETRHWLRHLDGVSKGQIKTVDARAREAVDRLLLPPAHGT